MTITMLDCSVEGCNEPRWLIDTDFYVWAGRHCMVHYRIWRAWRAVGRKFPADWFNRTPQ